MTWRALQVEGGGIVDDALAIRKPDPQTMLQSVGPRVKNPRARHQYPEVVQSKGHLPPPIFPGVHGHGVVTSYLGADNQFRDTLGGSLSPLKMQNSSMGDSTLNNSRSRGMEPIPGAGGQKRCVTAQTRGRHCAHDALLNQMRWHEEILTSIDCHFPPPSSPESPFL